MPHFGVAAFLPGQRHPAADTPGRAPHLSIAAVDRLRSAPARTRVRQSDANCGTRVATPRQAFPGRIEPRASHAQPASARRKRPESRRNSARAAAASAHTPTARQKCACPAPHRAESRRPRNGRAAPQAYPDARRTLKKLRTQPAADAARACQGRATQMPKWHPRRTAPQRLSSALRAPRQPCPACPRPAQTSREPAQQRARRGSQCTQANRSPKCTHNPPRAVRRLAIP